jgi:hypothetical protein
MTTHERDLKPVFEKYMRAFYHEHGRFTINDFVDFAVTLLNYEINSQIRDAKTKKDAAYYLATLYNQGMGNRIEEDDLQSIAKFIYDDYSLDFEILERINT